MEPVSSFWFPSGFSGANIYIQEEPLKGQGLKGQAKFFGGWGVGNGE